MSIYSIVKTIENTLRRTDGLPVASQHKKTPIQPKVLRMPLDTQTDIAVTDISNSPAESIVPRVNRSAIIETLVFLVTAVLIDLMFGNGIRYADMPVHPFWIIVLLVTVQYGPIEAITAALLSGAFLLVGNLPEQSMTETMYEYILRVTLTPFLWIVTALVLGSIRARQRDERKNLLNQLWKSEQAAAAIVENYKAAKQSKERLELRLAEERCSVLTVYEVAKMLETLDPVEAMTGVEKLVRTALNPKKFSLYRWKNNTLVLDTAYGWDKQEDYDKKFGGSSLFVRRLLKDNQVLSIVREEDEKLLNGQGMLAGPIVDEETGAVFGMLKIEEIGFTDLGIRTHEVFRIVCGWIARVCVNINKFEEVAGKSFLSSASTKSVKKRRVKTAHKPDNDVADEAPESAA